MHPLLRIVVALECLVLGACSGGDVTSGDSGMPPGTDAGAPAPLTEAQRVAFLHYYAPIILKRADEDGDTLGQDWITSFDFDQDGWDLSNNRSNWVEGLKGFVEREEHRTWQIRPTLYTAVLELAEGGTRSVVLLYHVYHALQGSAAAEGVTPAGASIHDWERIEVRVDGVRGGPGTGERLNYVVITAHSTHQHRLADSARLKFQETPNGRHPLIWQAQGMLGFPFNLSELHFVESDWEALDARNRDNDRAQVQIDDPGPVDFHYVFVGNGDPDAVRYWEAEALGQCNASELGAGTDDPREMSEAHRIQYELQDLADLWRTHWDDGSGPTSWKEPPVTVELESPIVSEAGDVEVPAGRHRFLTGSIDLLDEEEDRNGYPRKHWFWGAYLFGQEGAFMGGALDDAAPGGSRCAANGIEDCRGFMWQHDYFAHDGVVGGDGPGDEVGHWLPRGWHTPEAGGFDGRWVQLFSDEPPPNDCR